MYYEYGYEDKPGRLASKRFVSLQEVKDYLSDWQYLPVIYRREAGSQEWVPIDKWYPRVQPKISFITRIKTVFRKFAR